VLAHSPTTKWKYSIIKRSLEPEVFDTVFAAIEALLPVHPRLIPSGVTARGSPTETALR
jgi:hypothetical protein